MNKEYSVQLQTRLQFQRTRAKSYLDALKTARIQIMDVSVREGVEVQVEEISTEIPTISRSTHHQDIESTLDSLDSCLVVRPPESMPREQVVAPLTSWFFRVLVRLCHGFLKSHRFWFPLLLLALLYAFWAKIWNWIRSQVCSQPHVHSKPNRISEALLSVSDSAELRPQALLAKDLVDVSRAYDSISLDQGGSFSSDILGHKIEDVALASNIDRVPTESLGHQMMENVAFEANNDNASSDVVDLKEKDFGVELNLDNDSGLTEAVGLKIDLVAFEADLDSDSDSLEAAGQKMDHPNLEAKLDNGSSEQKMGDIALETKLHNDSWKAFGQKMEDIASEASIDHDCPASLDPKFEDVVVSSLSDQRLAIVEKLVDLHMAFTSIFGDDFFDWTLCSDIHSTFCRYDNGSRREKTRSKSSRRKNISALRNTMFGLKREVLERFPDPEDHQWIHSELKRRTA